MRRKFTIALAGMLVCLGVAALAGTTPAAAALRYEPAPPAKSAAAGGAATSPVIQTSQFRQRYRPRFRPPWRRPNTRRYGGRGAAGRLMSMREAVQLVRARVPGRIANAGLRGRIAWFRVISRGRVLNVTVDRLRRTLRVRRGF